MLERRVEVTTPYDGQAISNKSISEAETLTDRAELGSSSGGRESILQQVYNNGLL